MCDPISLGIAALGAGASLFGNKSGGAAAPAPPPVVNPATPQMAARDPNADVKVGDGVAAATATTTPQYTGFTEQRTFGKPLGGLGRGGLGL